ncbi:MAG: cyclopropane-fatty-acyl-phospholipid synthase [Alphaproteobacteria bacterium]|nr:cyclopropane-fatty-acyl-phospholipid synthase [Alphaproteobacteria bacterium]
MKNALKDISHAMHEAVPDASFAVRFWDDEIYKIGEAPAFTLWFRNKDAASRVIADGFLGFGEGYMHGEIEVEGDLQLLFRLGFAVGYTDHSMSLTSKIRIFILYLLKQNTLSGSRKNIAHHYDVGNEFYRRFLGPTMVYTCAYYDNPDRTLEEAQTAKLDLVCRKLQLKEGEHIADLGCGWGGLLIHAAQNFGVTGVGVTLSQQQVDYGMKRILELGLQDRIRIEYKDYRELEGTFDKVASVGLMEHVGIRFVPDCFKKIKTLLKPRGIGLVHTIGNDVLRKADPWFEKYIFPGGQCPPLSMLIEGVCENGMNVVDVENLRLHYELTLFHWIENFCANEEWILENYDAVFLRMYRLYLEVCAASFRYGDNRLFQILFTNGLSDLVPLTRADLYTNETA